MIENLQSVYIDDSLKDRKDTFDLSTENFIKNIDFSFFEQFMYVDIVKSNSECICSKDE